MWEKPAAQELLAIRFQKIMDVWYIKSCKEDGLKLKPLPYKGADSKNQNQKSQRLIRENSVPVKVSQINPLSESHFVVFSRHPHKSGEKLAVTQFPKVMLGFPRPQMAGFTRAPLDHFKSKRKLSWAPSRCGFGWVPIISLNFSRREGLWGIARSESVSRHLTRAEFKTSYSWSLSLEAFL